MKKLLTILSVLALLFAARSTQAQIINPGFETWSYDVLVPAAMNPNSGSGTSGWWTFNMFNYMLLGSSPISVTRCSDTVHTGTYSARIQTKIYTSTSWNYYKNWGIPFIGHIYLDTLGILFDGNVNETSAAFKPGIPFTQQITQFSFWYQYHPVNGDTAVCRVELVHSSIPVAGGWFKTNVATGGSGWQQAVVNLTYISGLLPDTLWVLFSSSSLDRHPQPGSVLWIDDVTVTLGTGVSVPLNDESEVRIFPNPSTDNLTIEAPQSAIIEITNVQGQLIRTFETSGNATNLDISAMPCGLYIMQVKTEKGVAITKFVKE